MSDAAQPDAAQDHAAAPAFAPWNRGQPASLDDLFAFYHRYVKVLYAAVQTENDLPQEVLFELNAALDHISRQWTYNEPESKAVHKAYGHLKRACLDIFKLRLRKAVDQCKQLRRVDLTILDNGEFVKALNEKFLKIQRGATEARQLEGRTDTDLAVPAFGPWEQVYVDCVEFEEQFFCHPHLNWAWKRGWMAAIRRHGVGFVLGVVASLVAALIWKKMGN